MSSSGFKTPLRVTFRRSRVLAALLAGAHLAAAATLLLLPNPLAVVGGLLVGFSLWRTLRTHVFQAGPRALKGLVWQTSGRIIANDSRGIEHEVAVANDTFVHPVTIVLNLVFKDRTKRTLVLLPDSARPAVLRELRKRLRMAARGGSAT